MSATTPRTGKSITVSFAIRNTGGRAGEEVAQLYVRHINSKVEGPIEELKGFSRISLRPGEEQAIRLTLPAERLAYRDAGRQAFAVEPDRVELLVGSSSADIKLRKTVTVRD